MDEDDVVHHPDDLPRHRLSNFVIYKDDGLMTTLELLPMWSGNDPDVDMCVCRRRHSLTSPGSPC